MARVLIVTTVPSTHLEVVLEAIVGAGGGTIGEYTHCAFTNEGFGRFKPSAHANPHSGQKEQVNVEQEVRLETFCPRDQARQVVAALRGAHPYEQPVIYVIPILEEIEL